jgi:hypothetical protein
VSSPESMLPPQSFLGEGMGRGNRSACGSAFSPISDVFKAFDAVKQGLFGADFRRASIGIKPLTIISSGLGRFPIGFGRFPIWMGVHALATTVSNRKAVETGLPPPTRWRAPPRVSPKEENRKGILPSHKSCRGPGHQTPYGPEN